MRPSCLGRSTVRHAVRVARRPTRGAEWAPMTQIGRYRLDRVLGSGSFATVWKGYDAELDIAVAIKVLADNWSLNADVRERFLTEARLLRRIASGRVVGVHDVGVVDGPALLRDGLRRGAAAWPTGWGASTRSRPSG